jgi:hypothetical protein
MRQQLRPLHLERDRERRRELQVEADVHLAGRRRDPDLGDSQPLRLEQHHLGRRDDRVLEVLDPDLDAQPHKPQARPVRSTHPRLAQRQRQVHLHLAPREHPLEPRRDPHLLDQRPQVRRECAIEQVRDLFPHVTTRLRVCERPAGPRRSALPQRHRRRQCVGATVVGAAVVGAAVVGAAVVRAAVVGAAVVGAAVVGAAVVGAAVVRPAHVERRGLRLGLAIQLLEDRRARRAREPTEGGRQRCVGSQRATQAARVIGRGRTRQRHHRLATDRRADRHRLAQRRRRVRDYIAHRAPLRVAPQVRITHCLPAPPPSRGCPRQPSCDRCRDPPGRRPGCAPRGAGCRAAPARPRPRPCRPRQRGCAA